VNPALPWMYRSETAKSPVLLAVVAQRRRDMQGGEGARNKFSEQSGSQRLFDIALQEAEVINLVSTERPALARAPPHPPPPTPQPWLLQGARRAVETGQLAPAIHTGAACRPGSRRAGQCDPSSTCPVSIAGPAHAAATPMAGTYK
jgi:hypothetical protein